MTPSAPKHSPNCALVCVFPPPAGGPGPVTGEAASTACFGLILAATLLTGRASPTTGAGYYWHTGHLSVMHAARPVDDWLQDA
jgi:hypothetical protein